jgi:long-chain fatty acid transport protein
MSFQLKSLSLAVATLSAISTVHAAGLDRSTQPSWAFTQDGTFAYVEHITISPDVAGKDNKNVATPESNYAEGKNTGNMTEDYQFLNFGAKADINDRVSVGAFFDQPWGADVQYNGDNNFVAKDANTTIQDITANKFTNIKTADQTLQNLTNTIKDFTGKALQETDPIKKANLNETIKNLSKQAENLGLAIKSGLTNQSNIGQGTNVKFTSQNFTGMVGVKLGENKNIQVYGGPTIQKLEGDVHLRGSAYSGATGYDASMSPDTAYGWMAGVAYSKPEIALKAALTYRSEIKHDTRMAEHLPLAAAASGGKIAIDETSNITVETPRSVNLDFQTGLNPTTLLTAKLRWVPWSDFAITPKNYNALSKLKVPAGTPLVSYDKDSWSGEVGLGKKLNSKWALSGSVGYDTGAGNPVTSLGPVEGNWNVGLGAKYNLTPEWAISGGAKYLMFGDAKAKLPTGDIVGDFKDNDGWVYGVRLSYQKK